MIEVAQERSVDIVALARRLWVRRMWLLGGLLIGGVLLGIYAFLATPIFRGSTVLVPASQDRSQFGSGLGSLGGLGGLASLAGVSFGDDSDTEEALAVLRSRQFIEAFIVDKQLMNVLFPNPEGQPAWMSWLSGKPSMARAYRRFAREILSLNTDKKTGLVTLDVDWKDREQAAAWANELVERINAEMRERAIAQATASINHLQSELEATSDVGTRQAINRLIETQINQRMVANVNKEYAFRVVDPAVVPEPIEKVRPKRGMLTALGCVLGMMMAAAVVMVVDRKLLR